MHAAFGLGRESWGYMARRHGTPHDSMDRYELQVQCTRVLDAIF